MVSPAVEESVKVLAPSPYDLFLWGETVEMEALVLEEPLLFEAHRLKWSSINYVIENEILNTTSECAKQHGGPGMVYCIEVSDFDAGENISKLNIPHTRTMKSECPIWRRETLKLRSSYLTMPWRELAIRVTGAADCSPSGHPVPGLRS